MCCILVYDKFLFCKFKGLVYREVFFVLREKFGIRFLFDIVFFLLFLLFVNESSMKIYRLWMCKLWNGFLLKREGFYLFVNKKKYINLFMINIDRFSIVYVLLVL